eukprot:5977-Prorocentrum_minimum.AAC.1
MLYLYLGEWNPRRAKFKFQQVSTAANFEAPIATALAGSHPTVCVDPNGHVSVSDWPIYPHGPR